MFEVGCGEAGSRAMLWGGKGEAGLLGDAVDGLWSLGTTALKWGRCCVEGSISVIASSYQDRLEEKSMRLYSTTLTRHYKTGGEILSLKLPITYA
jgi:hypothetical protein